jgi:hypothetical protein
MSDGNPSQQPDFSTSLHYLLTFNFPKEFGYIPNRKFNVRMLEKVDLKSIQRVLELKSFYLNFLGEHCRAA